MKIFLILLLTIATVALNAATLPAPTPQPPRSVPSPAIPQSSLLFTNGSRVFTNRIQAALQNLFSQSPTDLPSVRSSRFGLQFVSPSRGADLPLPGFLIPNVPIERSQPFISSSTQPTGSGQARKPDDTPAVFAEDRRVR